MQLLSFRFVAFNRFQLLKLIHLQYCIYLLSCLFVLRLFTKVLFVYYFLNMVLCLCAWIRMWMCLKKCFMWDGESLVVKMSKDLDFPKQWLPYLYVTCSSFFLLCHILLYLTIPYFTLPFHLSPLHAITYLTMPYLTLPCLTLP